MGNLMERSCDNCANLFEALSMGVCEVVKHHTVEKDVDAEKALTCKYYINKYYPDNEKDK